MKRIHMYTRRNKSEILKDYNLWSAVTRVIRSFSRTYQMSLCLHRCCLRVMVAAVELASLATSLRNPSHPFPLHFPTTCPVSTVPPQRDHSFSQSGLKRTAVWLTGTLLPLIHPIMSFGVVGFYFTTRFTSSDNCPDKLWIVAMWNYLHCRGNFVNVDWFHLHLIRL